MTENHSFTPQERLLEEANIVDRQAKKAGGIDDETLLVKFARALLALSEFACQLECEVYSFDLGNRQQRLQIDRLEHELAAANANRLLAEHERNEARAALSAIVPTTLIEAWKALPPFCREEGATTGYETFDQRGRLFFTLACQFVKQAVPPNERG